MMPFDNQPSEIKQRQQGTESLLENLFFNRRPLWITLFVLATLFLGFQAQKLTLDASFDKIIPTQHPYIQNYLEHSSDLKSQGNAVRIVLENTQGDIYNAEFQEVLRQAHDEVFFIKGVNRAVLKSIWAAGVTWMEVTEDGFAGDTVMPKTYNGDEASLQLLRTNVIKSGQVGALVANNHRSAVIYAPLMEKNPETGEPLDYHQLSQDLERLVRDKYQSDTIKIHITGFAKVVGDLIDGATEVVFFFAIALAITAAMLFGYSRCLRSTAIAMICSVAAVAWQLGLLQLLGFTLDPYSMLVPFLVFAIAVSHAVQIINTIAHQTATGLDRYHAARSTFAILYRPGLTALISDGVGFATLLVIGIEVIQDLAVLASVGVAVIILTNLVLLPIIMSYTGVSDGAIKKLMKEEGAKHHPVWKFIAAFTQKKPALLAIAAATLSTVGALYIAQDLKIGDLNKGAPELRADSRYNLDNAFITENYATSTDVFVVMVKTLDQQCADYNNLITIDDLEWRLQHLEGVQSTSSMAGFMKLYQTAMSEGDLKWMTLTPSQQALDVASTKAPMDLVNRDCNMVPVVVYLNDHKAETLTRVVDAVELFSASNGTESLQFLLAAGNAGIEASTNMVISEAQYDMLIWVYCVVAALCLLTFRSIRAVICIMIPLMLTSILCQALMAWLGMGVKVATLPVIALGVGVGVDYGIYIFSKLRDYFAEGMSLQEAYLATLTTTGKAVAFTGMTLAVGVGTWFFSPIKFQADMGLLLTFMFLWNMVGALVLLPALARFLLKEGQS